MTPLVSIASYPSSAVAQGRGAWRARAIVALLAFSTWAAVGSVAPGDPRRGYDDAEFKTDSRQLAATDRESLDLLALFTNPPLGLAAVPVPADNPPTAAKIALGRKLFFDRRLSFNATLSCGMCHVPEQGFAQEELRTPVGFQGRDVRRNAPTLLNVGFRPRLFLDGRETSLENQVWAPLLQQNEMANPSIGSVLERIRSAEDYAGLFEAAFGRGVSMETLGGALASYERALLAGNSAFDRFYFGGDAAALDERAQRGLALFGSVGCARCHRFDATAAQFTDDAFHDTGIGYRQAMRFVSSPTRLPVAPGVELPFAAEPLAVTDLGRSEITSDPNDRFRFRTPSLRNVERTAPYMHDGSIATLAEVVAFYDRGGEPHPTQDPAIQPLHLTAEQRDALVAFLVALTGSNVDALAADARSVPIGD